MALNFGTAIRMNGCFGTATSANLPFYIQPAMIKKLKQ